MNPGEPFADKPPVDELTQDDAVDDALAIYDEAITSRRVHSGPSETSLGVADSATPAVQLRMQRLQNVLHRLEQDRRLTQAAEPAGSSPSIRVSEPGTHGDGGRELGRFQILRELGQGGWGIVFLAWDPNLHRNVALKVPRPEAILSSEHRRRFVREAQAAAGLDHPGIVPVYEAGEIGPIWYIASAYCEGSDLASWLTKRNAPVPPRCAAELVAALAEAMHYTHGRGIVHRDLKPSNILLPFAASESEGMLGVGFGQPKITDFGLAKLLEHHGDETRSGLLLGTPAYMTPEQAEGRLNEIGPPTDVYSLGVILYELLTGQVPFRGHSDLDTLRQIGICEPIAPGQIRQGLPRDLEAICLKCLEKPPTRRYPLAGDLATDLRRFLEGEPTLARPLAGWQRAVKWSRRRPAAAALVCVSLLAAFGLSSLGFGYVSQIRSKNVELQAAMEEAVEQRTLAEQGERRASRQAYAAVMGRADDLRSHDQNGLLAELLGGLRPEPGKADLRDFAWHYLWRVAHKERFLRGHRFPVSAVAFSPDGTLCVSGGSDRSVKIWDVATGTLLTGLQGHTEEVVSVAFSPDGTRIASASGSYAGDAQKPGEVILWDTVTGSPLADLTGPRAFIHAVAFTPDGRSLVMAGAIDDSSAGVVSQYDLDTELSRVLLTNPLRFTSLALSADGRYLATSCGLPNEGLSNSRVELLDLHTAKKKSLVSDNPLVIECLTFSPSGKFLAVGGLDVSRDWNGIVRLWDLTDGDELQLFRDDAARTPVKFLAFSRDGQALWTNSHDLEPRNSTLREWDVATRGLRSNPIELAYTIKGLVFSPDEQTLALACSDHLVRLWELGVGDDFQQLAGHSPEAWSVTFSPAGDTLASAGDDHAIKLRDPVTGYERTVLRGHTSLISQIAFSPDGQWLTSASYDNTVGLWDAVTGERLETFEGHTREVRCVAFSPDGQTLASAGKDRVIKVWDLATRQQRFELQGHSNQVRSLAFSPDGRTLVSASEDRTLRFWDPATGGAIRKFEESSEVWALAFTPDGRFLASGNKNGIVKVWEFSSGRERSVLRGHLEGVRTVAFSADGRTLASGSGDRTIRLWQPETGHELLCLTDQPHAVNSVAFSRDGETLAAALHDGTLRLFTAPIEREEQQTRHTEAP